MQATRSESTIAALITALLGASLLIACHKVPITNRRQVNFVPERQEQALGAAAFQDVLKEEPLSTNRQYKELVERVGRRIAAATNVKDYDWAFKVLASDTPNAFCLPGGKVAFYEGIMPACQTEAGIAVVMGHEVAHAIARHGGERMSKQMVVQLGALGVDIASREKTEQERMILLGAYGGLAQFGYILPFSRKHESEADHMGIIYMARAGYDPTEAKRFWSRFGEFTGGGQPPEFLSTHPAHDTRSQNLKDLEAAAMAEYKKAPQKYGMGDTLGSAPSSKESGSPKKTSVKERR